LPDLTWLYFALAQFLPLAIFTGATGATIDGRQQQEDYLTDSSAGARRCGHTRRWLTRMSSTVQGGGKRSWASKFTVGFVIFELIVAELPHMQAAHDTWNAERNEDVSGIPTLRAKAA